ncbi:metallopeptidase family protein [Pelagovum pacificum]|uniref:Metallopeptidase family protein n=1 Tax=Pelagovum pacificum TaxID=2588711 RepID=A0A5C5GED5_9RHOB|nr:metallopeptidase family protein [Pelagovum pacificum]QQA43737.1 metallopeptidase family protein [Pelagovum pacificum]TNY33132.1 metallopeptidase family protein [Pelagovum pacificum]
MDLTAPTLDEIEQIARDTVETLPETFRDAARAVSLRVVEFPPDDVLEDMEAGPFDISGLYDGVPLTQKSVMDVPSGPDTVWLFRRALLDEWAERGNVTFTDLVAHVTVHEFAHHFGWSDDDIAAIDQWWD